MTLVHQADSISPVYTSLDLSATAGYDMQILPDQYQ